MLSQTRGGPLFDLKLAADSARIAMNHPRTNGRIKSTVVVGFITNALLFHERAWNDCF